MIKALRSEWSEWVDNNLNSKAGFIRFTNHKFTSDPFKTLSSPIWTVSSVRSFTLMNHSSRNCVPFTTKLHGCAFTQLNSFYTPNKYNWTVFTTISVSSYRRTSSVKTSLAHRPVLLTTQTTSLCSYFYCISQNSYKNKM